MYKLGFHFFVLQAVFQNSNLIVLRTCCNFQSTYLDGRCTDMNERVGSSSFPPTLDMRPELNSSTGFQLQLRSKPSKFECSGSIIKVVTDMALGHYISEVQLFPEGYLKLGSVTLPPNKFCVNSVSTEKRQLEPFACNQTCETTKRCLPKCCPWGQTSRWLHPNLCYERDKKRGSNLVPKTKTVKTLIPFYHHNLNCLRQGRMIATASINIFNSTQFEEALQSLPHGSYYCLDDVITSHDINFNWSLSVAFFYCGNEWPIDEFGLTALEKAVYGGCFIVSSIFLLTAIGIYYIKLHRTHSYVHTWIEFFYMISLMMLGIFFGLHVYFPETQEQYCTLYHFIVVFGYTVFGVSLFSWASLLSFDLFVAFKQLRPLGLEMARKDLKRLLWYCLLGFSFPFLVAVSTFLYSYMNWKDAGFCIPLQFTAIRFIQGTLLLTNLFFFVCTFYLIFKHRRKAKFATGRSPKELNQLVRCFVKLFVISGITYGGVIVGYVFGTERNSSWYLMIFRIFLNLRGVTVFFIYACNPQMKKLLQQRYKVKMLNMIDGMFCGCVWCRGESPPKNGRMLSLRSTLRRTEVIT